MPTKPFLTKFDQGDGSVHFHNCVRFFDGQVWTESHYLAAKARQQFRRSVVSAHLKKDNDGYYHAV